MSNEPAKKIAPSAPPAPTSDAPPGFDVRMAWITLIPKDLTLGGQSLWGRVDGRKDTSPNGNEIYWSRNDRHYWVGRYIDGRLTAQYRVHEILIGTSQEWGWQ